MASYEVVREIQNSCAGNQMRDVFFDEIETDDPRGYVLGVLGNRAEELTVEDADDGGITVHASSGGLRQRFVFTPL